MYLEIRLCRPQFQVPVLLYHWNLYFDQMHVFWIKIHYWILHHLHFFAVDREIKESFNWFNRKLISILDIQFIFNPDWRSIDESRFTQFAYHSSLKKRSILKFKMSLTILKVLIIKQGYDNSFLCAKVYGTTWYQHQIKLTQEWPM